MGNVKAQRLSIVAVVLAAIGLFALYFAGMGGYPLVDPDEPVYGQVAKEMAAGAGWLTPHYDGKPWFDKPPLFYWFSGGCAKLLGPTELASRLPSAVLAVAVLLWLYFLVKHDFGRRAALFASVAMATCIQTIVLARAAVTDMTLVFCLMGALYAYRRWFDEVESGKRKVESPEGNSRPSYSLLPIPYSLRWMALCGAMTGLGMLAKGPVAPFLLFVTFFIHLCVSRRLRRLVSVDALAGIASALIVGLPWYAAMYAIHRDAFVQGFIVANNLARFVKPEHSGITGAWYSYFLNIPVLALFFFPWSAFLPLGFLRFRGANDGSRLAAIWFAVVFVFFSLSKTQLVTYIFPLYPAAALFVGVLLDRAASGENGSDRTARGCLVVTLAVSALLAAALPMLAWSKYPEATVAACWMGEALVLAAAVALRDKPARAVWTIATGMAVFVLILMFGVVPRIAPAVSTRDIVRSIPRAPGDRVAEYGLRKPSLLFYLGFTPQRLRGVDDAKRLLGGKVSTWVICKDRKAALLRIPGCVETTRMGGYAVIANESAANRERRWPK